VGAAKATPEAGIKPERGRKKESVALELQRKGRKAAI